MKDGPMGNRVARILAVAVAGLFAGHVIVYRILAPGRLQRSVLTGGASHAYLPFAPAPLPPPSNRTGGHRPPRPLGPGSGRPCSSGVPRLRHKRLLLLSGALRGASFSIAKKGTLPCDVFDSAWARSPWPPPVSSSL